MPSKKILIAVAIITPACLLAGFFIYNYVSWSKLSADRAFPGTKIGDIDCSRLSAGEIKDLVLAKVSILETEGLKFQYQDKVVSLSPASSSLDASAAYPIFTIKTEETVARAIGTEDQRTFWSYLVGRFSGREANEIAAVYEMNEISAKTLLAENFPELNIKPENAYFSLTGKSGSWKIKSNGDRPGKEIDYKAAFEAIKDNLARLNNETIILRTQSQYPTVSPASLAGLEAEAENIINRGRFNIVFQESSAATTTVKFWEISPSRLITWISSEPVAGKNIISLDQEKIRAYLEENVSPQVDKAAALPRFEMKDGRVTSWQKGTPGYKADLEASANKIKEAILAGQTKTELIMEDVPAEDLESGDIKIKEIIGTGHSNFSGSPANRRHNIATGAAAISGLLIKPGEEFSLIGALGEIDGDAGYLTELVIKGNKTVPEYGGGLCQIGTTVFRTALASGLPITMRQNHSYRVSYYEPAGTDATIYDPTPDLRFVNDTGNYVLIQSRINKNDIYFDFWGVSDGRTATTTYPTIYNIVKPQPTKIVETENLKPGEKKCTESSHNGADAFFDYIVTYPAAATSTPVHERRFTSHYVPWQAVCLVGKSATSTPVTAASSTSPTAATSSPIAN